MERAPAEKLNWIGQAILARYEVSRRLAAGPSGDLYIAHDGESGAGVTIELLPAGIRRGDDRIRSLRDELSVTRAVARIRPNVAIVHDCDRTADGRAFIVLERLDGRSLADLIRQEGSLPIERALRLAFETPTSGLADTGAPGGRAYPSGRSRRARVRPPKRPKSPV